MTHVATPPRTGVYVGGSFTGQLVVGDHNIVINADHGAVVNVARPEDRPRVRPRDSHIWNAPRSPAGLLDRQAELDAAAAAMHDARPIEFYGEPGIGKTTLLNALAGRADPAAFGDGLAYVPARRQHAEDVRQCLFETFFACDTPYMPSDAALRAAFHDRRALVVLDDLELEREDAEALLDLAPRCAFVVATTERTMWRDGMCARRVGGLPRADAVALFERELGRTLAANEREAVEQLCSALDGHPLRVLQAAASAREERRTFAAPLATARAAGAAYVPTERQRSILMTLGVLGVPLDFSALRALSGVPDFERELAALEQRHLLRLEEGRYQLALDPPPADEETRGLVIVRALAHYSALANRRQRTHPVVAERTAIMQTVAMALRAGWPQDALRLARLAEIPLAGSALWGAWGKFLSLEVEAARAAGDQAAEAWALHQIGSRALCLGDAAGARTSLIEALRIREALHDVEGAAVTRHNLDVLGGAPPISDDGTGGRALATVVRRVLPFAVIAAVGAGIWGLWPKPPVPSRGAARVQPASVAFAPVSLGARGTQRLAVLNEGNVPLTITDVTLAPGGTGFQSDAAGCVARSLRPGDSCAITITFAPTAPGEYH